MDKENFTDPYVAIDMITGVNGIAGDIFVVLFSAKTVECKKKKNLHTNEIKSHFFFVCEMEVTNLNLFVLV